MKLALFTIFRVPNFGSVLQTYATQYCLEKQGHSCIVIDYKEKQTVKQKVKIFFSLYNIACLLGIRPQFRKPRQLRKFINKYIHISGEYDGTEKLQKENWSKIDALVVGSDQVWNYRYQGKDNVYLLPFANNQTKCYALASSFAVNSIPDDYKKEYKTALSKFKAISVREKNGVNIIESLNIGKTAKLVLDPTLWISGEEWLTLFRPKYCLEQKPYILLYMWTYAFEPRPYIYEVLKYWQQKLGDCRIIALEGSPKKKECPVIEIEDVADSTIPEFLNYFAHAALVITSSFHGTAFAVNYGRPLISIVPDESFDDRQSSLLSTIGADNSIIPIGKNIEDINPYYEADKVSSNLNALRADSMDWINQNIV